MKSWLPLLVAVAALAAVCLLTVVDRRELHDVLVRIAGVEEQLAELSHDTARLEERHFVDSNAAPPMDKVPRHADAQPEVPKPSVSPQQPETPVPPLSQPVVPVSRMPSVGQFLELAGPTLRGETLDLKQLRGKVVLIDFWATWCGPCIGEMPNVLQVYDTYHDDGLEVVGISFDTEREKLEEFVTDKQIPWKQIFFEGEENQGWNNPLGRRFDIRGIPTMFVVDRDGKVRHVNVRGRAIELAVAELLGKEPMSEEQAASQRAKFTDRFKIATSPIPSLPAPAPVAPTSLTTDVPGLCLAATSVRGPDNDLVNKSLRSVALRWPYAYALDRNGGLWIFDCSESHAGAAKIDLTVEVAKLENVGDGNCLAIVGEHLLTARAGRLEVYGLKNPHAPAHLGQFGNTSTGGTFDLVVDGQRAILIGNSGITVFDVSSPAEPKELPGSKIDRFQWTGMVAGSHLYVGEIKLDSVPNSRDGITVYELTDANGPTEVAFFELDHGPYLLRPLAHNRCVIATGESLQLYDLNDAREPRRIGEAVRASCRTAAVLTAGADQFVVANGAVFSVGQEGLTRAGEFRAGSTPDGFPYRGASDHNYSAIATDQFITVLRFDEALKNASRN